MRVAKELRARFSLAGVVLVMAGFCLFAGCRLPTTVYGQLALKPGEEGDVRLARVELHDSAAWDSAPVYAVAPEAGGQFFRAAFEFPVVAPGPYYVLAWQDRDSNGRVSDGDLVGVHGDSNQLRRPGAPVIVYKYWTVDAGEIQMSTYEVLEVNASGMRSQSGDTTSFSYSFNHDVTLSSLALTFPGQPTLPDPSAAGYKAADSFYVSGGWSMGGQMPVGLHQLEFRGAFKDTTFALRVAVSVE
ncbi:hypothetical protein FJY68_06665 [candidate division WOR-3 bacterium]|uniref:Lipoprotein n=1 Tax=candidate division WOR-3 bacterium TaxID=2052148 RepID=A0A937XD57_UNCW3|nr:hypothetical protein [candidate division WOR-3 bacterium]